MPGAGSRSPPNAVEGKRTRGLFPGTTSRRKASPVPRPRDGAYGLPDGRQAILRYLSLLSSFDFRVSFYWGKFIRRSKS